jgi:hypothetical protein
MKLSEGRSTDYVSLPADETEKVIEAMKLAEQKNDIEALKWTARRIAWLDDTAEIISGDDGFHPAHIFNRTWAEMLKTDPPPESIAEIINRIDEDEPEQITVADADDALETVRAYLEESLGGKSYKAIVEKLDALKAAIVKTAGEAE